MRDKELKCATTFDCPHYDVLKYEVFLGVVVVRRCGRSFEQRTTTLTAVEQPGRLLADLQPEKRYVTMRIHQPRIKCGEQYERLTGITTIAPTPVHVIFIHGYSSQGRKGNYETKPEARSWPQLQ